MQRSSYMVSGQDWGNCPFITLSIRHNIRNSFDIFLMYNTTRVCLTILYRHSTPHDNILEGALYQWRFNRDVTRFQRSNYIGDRTWWNLTYASRLLWKICLGTWSRNRVNPEVLNFQNTSTWNSTEILSMISIILFCIHIGPVNH